MAGRRTGGQAGRWADSQAAVERFLPIGRATPEKEGAAQGPAGVGTAAAPTGVKGYSGRGVRRNGAGASRVLCSCESTSYAPGPRFSAKACWARTMLLPCEKEAISLGRWHKFTPLFRGGYPPLLVQILCTFQLDGTQDTVLCLNCTCIIIAQQHSLPRMRPR